MAFGEYFQTYLQASETKFQILNLVAYNHIHFISLFFNLLHSTSVLKT